MPRAQQSPISATATNQRCNGLTNAKAYHLYRLSMPRSATSLSTAKGLMLGTAYHCTNATAPHGMGAMVWHSAGYMAVNELGAWPTNCHR